MSVTIDPVNDVTNQAYYDQVASSTSLRAFSGLNLNETQRSQIRALTAGADQQSDPNAFNASVRSVLTPSQATQFDRTFGNAQNAGVTNAALSPLARNVNPVPPQDVSLDRTLNPLGLTPPLSQLANNPLNQANSPLAQNNPLNQANNPLAQNNPLNQANSPLAQNNPLNQANSPLAQNNPLNQANNPLAQNNPLNQANSPLAQNNPLNQANSPLAQNNPLNQANNPLAQNNPLNQANNPLAQNNPLNQANNPLAQNGVNDQTQARLAGEFGVNQTQNPFAVNPNGVQPQNALDANQNATPLQSVSYSPRTATEYYQALARAQNPDNTPFENSAQQISSLLGVAPAPAPGETNAVVQQAAADAINRQQTQRELQNFGATGGVLNGFIAQTAYPVALGQTNALQNAPTSVAPVSRIAGATNQSIQARV